MNENSNDNTNNNAEMNEFAIELEELTRLVNQLIEVKNEVKAHLDKFCNKMSRQVKQKNKELERERERMNNNNENDNDPEVSKVKVIRRRTNRSAPLNRSKYLNEEQRDQVLAFVNQEETLNLIKAQPQSSRISFVQKLIRENFNINLSLYMTGKIISILKL